MMPRRKRRLASRIRDGVRQLLAFLFTNVGVIVMVVAYTIAGAFMFQAIEGASEMERVNHMARERDNTAQYLWQNVTMVFNPLNETAMKHRISIELHQYQRKIVVAVRRGWDGGRSNRQWSFSSAFLYSLTVITTIGYGHLSPRTSWGKITTILYALLGMPLFLLYLSNVGELLARWFKCIYALACLCRGCPGFTRRRVARMRTQLEISEEESIERPEGWRLRQIDMASENRPNSRYPPSHYPYPRHLPSGYHERDADLRYPPDSRYPEARFPLDPRYPEPRFPPDSRYPEPRFPPDSRYPESRFPPDPRYSEARFAPDPRYPEAKFPLDPRYPEARSPPNRYFQDPRIPTARLPPRCPQDSRYYPSTRTTVPDSRYPESRFSPRQVPDSRYALDSRYPPHPNKYFQRRPDYFRSASMPQPWESARRPEVRGWSEPAPYRSESSEFSYVTFDAQTITVPLSVCVSIMVGYLMFGSMLFGMWESWDQLDGAYFCFISLTSIGFGDFVPGERVYTARIETSFIVCSLYLMLGMALVAMCFNLMQEQVIHYCAGLKRAIKRMCRCRCKR